MEIKYRTLNKNERFCCTKNDVKKIFENSNVFVSFAYFSRNFETNPKFYKGVKIKGKIIAKIGISHIDDEVYSRYSVQNAFLCFYVLKNEEFTEELQKEFLAEILPKMYAGYVSHKYGNSEKINGRYFFRVELFNNKFIIHEGIEIP